MRSLQNSILSKAYMLFPLMVLSASNLLPALLIMLGLRSVAGGITYTKPSASTILWALFMISSLVSSICADTPRICLMEWVRVAGLMICCYLTLQWVLQSKNINWQQLISTTQKSWLIAITLFAVEFISNGYLSKSFINIDINFFNKGACTLAVGLWLWIFSIEYGLVTARGHRYPLSAYLGASVLIYSMESEAAMVGLALSTIVFLLSRRYPNFYKILATMVAVGFITIPIIIYLYAFYYIDAIPYELRHSWDHRIYIAFNTIFLALEKLLLGWGFAASKGMYSIGQGYVVMMEAGGEPHALFNFHPHNSSLQVLLETGIIGLVIYSIAWATTIVYIGKNNKISSALKPYLYATLCCYIAIGQLNFSAGASWWLSLILLYMVLATSLNRGMES